MVVRAHGDSAQPDAAQDAAQYAVSHAECSYFGVDRDKVAIAALKGVGRSLNTHPLSDRTIQAMQAMAYVPPGSPTYTYGQSHAAGSIDSYIWADFQKNGITPAPPTTDWEFVRRVTLDLTGRIPTPAVATAFVNDTTPGKRANYIETLLASPQWVDKWTMFYGDLFMNNATKPSTGVTRFAQGRNALLVTFRMRWSLPSHITRWHRT
jgi:hypothetical protein